ncbi:hypothetical protein BKA66DRAFT_44676 [Pyrenochaeta sp. MPI-SDFR-AT-0127]|nr:hypothetical protein BKA66DRAFT_44676 [Pyrenochaeta sp. MPI-SDFR-AT-0127]
MAILPTSQSAIVGLSDGTLGISHEAPVPELADDMLIVRNFAVSLNPVDTKIVGSLATPGAIAGVDYAGKVVAIGAKTKTAAKIEIGDRICGTVQGMHSLTPAVGAFAQYVGANDITALKMPDGMSFEEGASMGCVMGTIGMALFQSLQVPGTPTKPAEKPTTILVYGGSTACGTFAIQLLRLSGLIPITTCSPRNFDLVKSYGAEAVFDYHLTSAAAEIKSYTKNSLKFALDCVSEPKTMEFCYKCIGRTGGRYTALEPFPEGSDKRPTVRADWVFGPAALGKKIALPPPLAREENPIIRDWTLEWFRNIQYLADTGKVRLHPLDVIDGGFEGILRGLDLLKRKQVSARKLIVKIPQTE